MLSILAAVFGIGLLLFVHELGHFLACRLARVHVEVFSLGFGPRLAGFRRGGTDFRLSWIPLGGYVRPAGDDPALPPRPGDIRTASAGWRFFIYSGGILMNFLFALVMIPLLFRIGIPMLAPMAGAVAPGSPAWQAGLRTGERLLAINGVPVHSFEQFVTTVALSAPGKPVELEVAGADGASRTLSFVPEYDANIGARRAGVSPPLAAHEPLAVALPGDAAPLPLHDGETVLALQGVACTGAFEATLLDEVMLQRPGGAVTVRVRAADGTEREETLALAPARPEDPPQVGVRRLENRVRAAGGALGGVLLPGDRLLAANGLPVSRRSDVLLAALRDGGWRQLVRERSGVIEELTLAAPLPPAEVAAVLWLEADPGVFVEVMADSPAESAGLRTGDRVLRIDGGVIDRFEDMVAAVRAAGGDAVRFLVARPGDAEPRAFIVQPAPMPRLPFGLRSRFHTEVVQRDNLISALQVGIGEARRMVGEVFLMLRRLFSGDVHRRNVGGIITIGQLTYASAESGLLPLLFFLSMMSLHLGVLNLLPIPALDGGHLLFILIEKLRGRPLSERTQGFVNLAGFVAVMSLLVFALSHDLQRLLG